MHGAQPPMWMICGDLNATVGSLLNWKMDYENDNDKVFSHQALANNKNNKQGDYMLSQGFSTIHVETTIGCSDNSRKHAGVSHNMVTQ